MALACIIQACAGSRVKALYVYCEGASIFLHLSCFQQRSSHLALFFADVAYDLHALSAAVSWRVSCINIYQACLAGRPLFFLRCIFHAANSCPRKNLAVGRASKWSRRDVASIVNRTVPLRASETPTCHSEKIARLCVNLSGNSFPSYTKLRQWCGR